MPVHVDRPASAPPTPRDADVMPDSVVGKRGLVRQVFPVDDERQEDPSLTLLAPQLELIGKNRSSVGEDGGHLSPRWVPLNTDANANGRQGGEGRVETSEALAGFFWEVES